jgi:microcompartment protein CcmL/EutN
METKMSSDYKRAIGLVEFNSIAAGIQASDEMLKISDVELLVAKTICPGKYICLVSGDVGAVRSSIDRGVEAGEETAIDHMVLPHVHESVFPAISATSQIEKSGALGVIETFSVATSIEAADAAAKAANISLIEVRLAVGLGGKSFVTMTGEIAAVRAAVEAGSAPVTAKGLLVRTVTIASPKKEMFETLM